MNRPASLFRRLILDHWLFKAACLSVVLSFASAALGLLILSLLSKSLESQPRDVAAASEGTIAGPVILVQIISLMLGVASFTGGIIKKNFAIILLALIGIFASGFLGYYAALFSFFYRMGC